MPSITFRITPELHERFLAECERRDTKPSELLRQMVQMAVDHMIAGPAKPIGPRTIEKGGHNPGPSRVVQRPPPPAPMAVSFGPVTAAPGSRLKKK
jgi:hypothetical protein